MAVRIRVARPSDGGELERIDRAAFGGVDNVVPVADASQPFFTDSTRPEDVLVAELDGDVAGYAKIRPPTPLASNAHVLQIQGLAVDPATQGRGVGRALIEGTVAEARRRGARKLSLRVLASNPNAAGLYAACGFEVEGVLRAEFRIDGRYVDDQLMARLLD